MSSSFSSESCSLRATQHPVGVYRVCHPVDGRESPRWTNHQRGIVDAVHHLEPAATWIAHVLRSAHTPAPIQQVARLDVVAGGEVVVHVVGANGRREVHAGQASAGAQLVRADAARGSGNAYGATGCTKLVRAVREAELARARPTATQPVALAIGAS